MERCEICGGRYKAIRHHKARMHRVGGSRRVTCSFSLDGALAREIERTRGSRSVLASLAVATANPAAYSAAIAASSRGRLGNARLS